MFQVALPTSRKTKMTSQKLFKGNKWNNNNITELHKNWKVTKGAN